MTRVLIADDEPLAVDRLRDCLAGIEQVSLVGVATHGDEALSLARALEPDLLLLDIQMPNACGLEVAEALKGLPIDIVFVTAFSDCAAIAFDLDATDYLLKPVSRDRLAEAIVRARRRRQARRLSLDDAVAPAAGQAGPVAAGPFASELWVRQKAGHRRVPVRDIQRIEADRDYALLHTGLRTFILRATMNELEQRLDPRELLRVHRSAFVRPDAVVEVQSHRRTSLKLQLADGAVVEVGASYADTVLEALGIAQRRTDD
ncbi:MAG: response regulator transcription factor [Sphingomonadales bacterium]|nr:response regulator transcription factor [Sphingomonadales bacterium]